MTQEIISHFKEKPKTKIAWWAFGLGLSLFLVPIATMTLSSRYVDLSIGNFIVIPGLIIPLTIAALTVSVLAYKKGERSFVLWIGIVPTILFSVAIIAEAISAIFNLGF
jgi:hypothetical protein